MYRLENWYFEKWGNHTVVWGSVYNNPNFLDGYFIHTSSIHKISAEEEFFHVITQSGSNYMLRYEDCQCAGEYFKNLEDNIAALKFSKYPN